MSIQIKGTNFLYEIDKKDLPDGFIASGTESFVFKGIKKSVGADGKSELLFSCVLKFKPKSKGRIDRFKNQELKIFEELQECRSVARIYDVVEDIGDEFELAIPETNMSIRNRKPSDPVEAEKVIPCFCVIEEYIDGWSLEQYCRRKCWGLEKFKNNRWVKFYDFTESEKEEVLKKYKDRKEFLRYQDKLLHFMQSLCGILMFISTSSKKKVLHLDIKPENIMVTRQSEELVLIDFGRSVFLPDGETFVYHELPNVHYDEAEDINSLFSHGTIGYAAPECYADAVESVFPFSQDGYEIGRMSIESDIFSFGATFWECMNIVELMTKNKLFADSPHDFYEKHLLRDEAYFDRDLSLECTGLFGGRYHLSLQNIISKCTKRRSEGYLESDNKYYYNDYNKLKNDIEEARDSVPTVKKSENKKIINTSVVVGGCIGIIVTLFLLSCLYKKLEYRSVTERWNEFVMKINTNGEQDLRYYSTKFDDLKEIALKRMELGNVTQKREICRESFGLLCKDNDISASEASFLVALADKFDNDRDKLTYVDKIMEYASIGQLLPIVADISKMGLSNGSLAYELAIAIYNIEEVTDYEYVEAYRLLQEYEGDSVYRNAIRQIAISLNNKSNITVAEIASETGETRTEVSKFLDKIENSR